MTFGMIFAERRMIDRLGLWITYCSY
jgi:hypothetical protein